MKNLILCAFVLLSSFILSAQNTTTSETGKQEFPNEAIVIEQYHFVSRFENDGTGLRRLSVRVKVQSEAGVQQLGVLTLPYDKAVEDIDVPYVRVRKPDGTIVPTPVNSAQDMPAPVTREAPVYSDLREKHINVVNLRPGDILEYELVNRVNKPLIPNQFWFDATLEKNAITLDEQIELNIPSSRAIKLKVKSGCEPKVHEEAGRKVYTWSHSNLQHHEAKPGEEEADADSVPDVQATSFASWQEFGRWFAEIQKDRVTPSAEVKAKALELTRGKQTEREKVEAIYNFVSQDIRYIGLEFGIGRFQANTAASILENSYGDCKDKHTLLASLLQGIGITAEPVLIHATRKFDPDIPSPSQFNHVITAVTLEGKHTFLDTTAEVAPFGMLVSVIRDKDALEVMRNGDTEIVHTPADAPFQQFIHLDAQGAIDKDGKVTARITQTLRGDEELMMRLAFLHTSREKWKDVAQGLAYLTGYGGEVSDISVNNLEDTSKSLEIKYAYTRENYLTWNGDSGTMRVALPPMGLTDPSNPREQKDDPVRFLRRTEMVYTGTMRLPEGVHATQPAGLNLSKPYAVYDSTYLLNSDTISIRRTLTIKETKGPLLGSADYKSFFDDVSRDYLQDLAVYRNGGAQSKEAEQQPIEDPADEAFHAGVQAMTRGDLFGARAKYQEAVKLNPKHPYAWAELARSFALTRDSDEALRDAQKQLQVNRNHPDANLIVASLLIMKTDKAGAIAALKRQIEVAPNDQRGRIMLARIYMQDKRYEEVIPLLQPIAEAGNEDSTVLGGLGIAYLKTGNKEKALGYFERWLKVSDKPSTKNTVAYELADNDCYLDRALELSKQSVAQHSANLHKIELSDLSMDNVREVGNLIAAWDTLGWVYFKKGNLEAAKSYIHASWVSEQNAEVAEHLAAVYERLGMNNLAVEYRSLQSSLKARTVIPGYAPPMPLPTRHAGGHSELSATERLQNLRTVHLSQTVKKDISSQFFVLLTSTGVQDVSFVGDPGDGVSLKTSLKSAKYPLELPDDKDLRIVRRGFLSCEQYNGHCMVVLLQPFDVKSLD